MIKYNADVIQQFAQDLYNRASSIIFANTVMFALGGTLAGYAAFGKVAAFIGLLVGGAIGYYIGAQKAFLLKLQAQTALCQAEIEKNTRNLVPQPVLSIESIAPEAATAKDETSAVELGPIGPSGER
jgi:hypothetical protein